MDTISDSKMIAVHVCKSCGAKVERAGIPPEAIIGGIIRAQNADTDPERKRPARVTLPPEDKLLIGRKEAASMLSIGCRALDYLVAKKQLTTRRIGARVLIPQVAKTRILLRALSEQWGGSLVASPSATTTFACPSKYGSSRCRSGHLRNTSRRMLPKLLGI